MQTFFKDLAKGSKPLQPHSLPLETLVIADIEMLPDLAIANQALFTLSRCASITRLELKHAEFMTLEKVRDDYDMYGLDDDDIEVKGANCLLKALAGFGLRTLVLRRSLWLEVNGDGLKKLAAWASAQV